LPSIYITEVTRLGSDYGGLSIMALQAPVPPSQIIAIGASSLVSLPIGGAARFIRVYTEAKCTITFGMPGTMPVATIAGGVTLPAEVIEYFGVTPGMTVAVIANTNV